MITVRLDIKKNRFFAEFSNLGLTDVPIEDEYSEYDSQYNYGEKIRYGIVKRLTNDIEANFKDWRKDVRKLFNDLHQDMLRKMVRNTYTMIILYIIVIIETICLIFF